MRTILLLLLLTSLFACSASKQKQGKKNVQTFIDASITMEKTPCYGTCPVYSITVSGDGKAIYTGKRFVERKGKYEKQFDLSKIDSLMNAFKYANFFDFKDEYTENITDMSTTYISFTYNGKAKKIKDYYNAPILLKQLEKMVEEIANTEGWTKIEDAPKEE